MLVTRETDYAIRTVLYLARDRDRVTSVAEIARNMQIPKSFLAKIVQRLVRHRILASIRGVTGGFRLAKRPAAISLLDILQAIQGDTGINLCARDKRLCKRSRTCSVFPLWVNIRKDVERRLRQQTMDDLVRTRR